MSDLLVTAITPALGSGTGLRTYGVTAALALDHPVEIAYVAWDAAQPAEEYERLTNVDLRRLHASRGPARAVRFLQALAEGVPRDLARGVSPALSDAARAAPNDVRVIADGPVVAAALLRLARTREIVYLAHNLESGGFRRESERTALKRFERNVLRAFSECWMATRADERGARALAGDRISTRYVPNVIDVGRIEPVRPAGARRLLFVGDFRYEPNAEALRFVTDSVLPAVWERRGDVHLTAVGRGLPDVARDPRITTPGFVEDLAAVYSAADVVLVPLLRGGGSPLKFIEGLAYGLPVVATPHAAGLLEDGVPGRDFLSADGADGFAAAIETLLADPPGGAAIGSAGRELVHRCYSIKCLARLLQPRAKAADTDS
jgi:glycosyltransferase involved in cell wall biosynthesis